MTAPGARLAGVLGGGRLAEVDAVGTVRVERTNWELAWWVGADDRWRFPDEEAAVRQSLLDGMPVVTTAMRVPGGDAVHRVYGATPAVTVVEVENDSPAPFVVALVVRGAAHVETDGATILADQRPAFSAARRSARWAVSVDGTTRRSVAAGDARSEPFGARIDRGARLEAAFLFPVAHRTCLRVCIPVDVRATATPSTSELPDAERVARGWRAQLARGMRVVVPDTRLQAVVDTARAQLLLAGQAWITVGEVVVALEDWGFDGEARAAWRHLGLFARRKVSRRPTKRAAWEEVRRLLATPGAAFLNALRSVLVAETDADVSLLSAWPDEWRGLPLDVRDAPTRRGPVSYSLRWHGDRVALLWDVPPNTTVALPAFDPEWRSTEARGETLLAPRR
jgi:hypothetical protein